MTSPSNRLHRQFQGLATIIAVSLLTAFAFSSALLAWTPTTPQVAVTTFGDVGAEVGRDVVVDASGNIYTTGAFTGTVDFDPGAATLNLTAAGGQDVFVTKLNSTGDLVWVRHFGGTGNDIGLSLALDSSLNVYVGGGFRDTADFDPGAGIVNLTAVGTQDAYVAKFDSSGGLVWARPVGGSSDDSVRSVSVDGTGSVFATGSVQGTADFDPGVGIESRTTAGASDPFVWKLDSSGGLVWARLFGGASIDVGASLAIGSAGDLFVSGQFINTADFDPGAGVSNMTSVGIQDAYLAKFDSSGGLTWARKLGGSGADIGASVVVDTSDNVYVTGSFQGTADFDPGAGTANLTPVGGTDVYVSKFNSSGNYVWARSIGGTNSEVGNAVTVDASNNVYTVGNFQDTADFDPESGTANLTSAGSTDMFISKLDSSGNFVWARHAGAATSDYGYGVAVDSSTNAYATGSFDGTVDFDPDSGTASLASAGGGDAFVWKLDLLGLAALPTSSTSTSPTTATTVAPTVTTTAPLAAQISGSATSTTVTTSTTAPNVTEVSQPSETSSATKVSRARTLPQSGTSLNVMAIGLGLLLVGGATLRLRLRRR